MRLAQLPSGQLGSNGTVGQGGDNLPNLLGADISGGKNPGDGGAAVLTGDDIAAGIRFHQIPIEGGVRAQTDTSWEKTLIFSDTRKENSASDLATFTRAMVQDIRVGVSFR